MEMCQTRTNMYVNVGLKFKGCMTCSANPFYQAGKDSRTYSRTSNKMLNCSLKEVFGIWSKKYLVDIARLKSHLLIIDTPFPPIDLGNEFRVIWSMILIEVIRTKSVSHSSSLGDNLTVLRAAMVTSSQRFKWGQSVIYISRARWLFSPYLMKAAILELFLALSSALKTSNGIAIFGKNRMCQ